MRRFIDGAIWLIMIFKITTIFAFFTHLVQSKPDKLFYDGLKKWSLSSKYALKMKGKLFNFVKTH